MCENICPCCGSSLYREVQAGIGRCWHCDTEYKLKEVGIEFRQPNRQGLYTPPKPKATLYTIVISYDCFNGWQ